MSTILDPLETFRIVNNTAAPMEMRSDALEALADMIAVGIPVHYSTGLVRDIPEDETGSPMNTLAAAVNAALANDDKSGLEGLGFKVNR